VKEVTRGIYRKKVKYNFPMNKLNQKLRSTVAVVTSEAMFRSNLQKLCSVAIVTSEAMFRSYVLSSSLFSNNFFVQNRTKPHREHP
jgi:hypothetical protein